MKATGTNILTINGGSPSIKFTMEKTSKSMKKSLNGCVDRNGLPGKNLTFSDSNRKHKDSLIFESFETLVRIAEGFGIRGILYTYYESTYPKLASFGLEAA